MNPKAPLNKVCLLGCGIPTGIVVQVLCNASGLLVIVKAMVQYSTRLKWRMAVLRLFGVVEL